MKAIRPLERDDLPRVAALYSDFVGWDAKETEAVLVDFFGSVLLDAPLADPEIPSLVYDDADDGVVGFIGSHARPFRNGDRTVRASSSGPLVVHPDHRSRGVGALLLRQYLAGPQEITINDRSIDQVHEMWDRLGGVTDAGTSIDWLRVLGPTGNAANAAVRRLSSWRERPPVGAGLVSALDGPARRRRAPRPQAGTTEPLTPAALIDLLERLRRQFPYRPAYDEPFLDWLFGRMEGVSVGDRFVRKLVRGDDGKPLGSYVMYVSRQGTAEVVNVLAGARDSATVLDHIVHEAAQGGAIAVRGRVETHLLPGLRERDFKLVHGDWSTLWSRDQELVDAVLSGRMPVTRMDGEWWMRPRREAAPSSRPAA